MSENKLNLLGLANEAFVKDLKTALSVPPKILVRLAEKFNTPNGVRLRERDTEAVLKIWSETGLPIENFNDTADVLKHLFKRAVEKEVSVENLLAEIAEVCQKKGIEGLEERRDALRAFLTPKPEYIERRGFIPFAQAVVRNLEAISAVVDLRTVFADTDSTEIKGYVPMAIIRVVCGFDNVDAEHSQRFTFQVTEKKLAKLIKALETYKKQLLEAKGKLGSVATLFDDPTEVDSDD
jgi:hypothetical protein